MKIRPRFSLVILLLVLTECGGGGGGGGSTSTVGQAQGVYSGTASNKYSFLSIVLPNDQFYGIYGADTGNVFNVYGMLTGQGTSGSTTYTAPVVTDFFYNGAINTGSITASYVQGSSLSGTIIENGTQTTFTGTSFPDSSFNYDTPASLSAISGSWIGRLLDNNITTVGIESDGTLSGSSAGCSFSGIAAADGSGKNFFDVSLTFGPSPCALPNKTASGIGVHYVLSDGCTHQLVAGVTVGTSAGTVFFAQKNMCAIPLGIATGR